MQTNLRLVADQPAAEMQKVGRMTDADYGRDEQKYLPPSQVEGLIKASSKAGRADDIARLPSRSQGLRTDQPRVERDRPEGRHHRDPPLEGRRQRRAAPRAT